MTNSDSEYESADEAVTESKDKKTKNETQEIPQQQQQERGGWRSWGAVNILSNASKHVASITTQVSQSIYDTVNNATSEESSESKIPSSSSAFGLDGILSESTKIVRDIGKKTINLLQENDPLSNLNAGNKPNLSQILKEAKEQSDAIPETETESKVVKFEQLLDDNQGFMSLEALEILSNQSKLKIELLLKSFHDKKATDELEETLDEVKELCDFDIDVDFDEIDVEKLFYDVDTLETKVDFTETVKVVGNIKNQISQMKNENSSLIYENSKNVLAKVCSLGLHNLHKFAESLLNKSHRSTANEAESLLQIATVYCSIFNYVATSFSEIIKKDSDENKKIGTNIFLESSHGQSYIKKAVDLFITIIQISVI